MTGASGSLAGQQGPASVPARTTSAINILPTAPVPLTNITTWEIP